ncbi:MAG: nucleotidyltransferase [Prevotellaceae bacterium]|jgi:bifunctional N-acetylglucosamine-1-phosphate-uridyltransferase/glucosamine-1-phosphate-acetyltransferase GlmU-like protein|nr:nucleotidyltransferase [Prevotellaceae bacterium]
MKPVLFVLAAGLGSRYGGLKQLDGVGPSGESIMEYSIYDAIRAGFGKVVFVIRHSFDKEFREFIEQRFAGKVPVEIVYQELDCLPEGYSPAPEREKPWGTNHAVLMAKDVIREPFCVINADDFYGRQSFEAMSEFLKSVEKSENLYSMIGFLVKNTLSENGPVSRGVINNDENLYLNEINECIGIQRYPDGIRYKSDDGVWHTIPENGYVSMNMWGFTPDYFEHSETFFKTFLDLHGKELKSEFFIPLVIDHLVGNNSAKVKILETDTEWFGVTYREDKPTVIAKLKQLIDNNIYPSNLWK